MAVVAVAASTAGAAPVLVSPSPLNDGSGYGGYGWTTFTADLNRAGPVTTTADLSNPTGYDGVWVDVRQAALTAAESAALTDYIATGRRVVFIGGNAAGFGTWNGSVLNLVGGADGGPIAAATLSRLAYVPLTTGVATVYARGGDVAVGGTSLFDQRVATVWGPARNVVVVLNTNVSSDNDVAKADNGPFTNNLAQWVAGSLPDPTSLWQSPSGGSWQAGSNWLAAAMPAVADDAVFNLSAGYTTTVAGPVTARTVTVGTDRLTLDFSTATAGLTLGSTLTVGTNGGTLSLTHSAGGGVVAVSAGAVVVGAAGSLRVDTGTRLTAASLSAAGPLAVAGRLVLTAPAGTAARVGMLSLDPTGQLDLGSSDLIVTNGDLAAVTADVAKAYDGGAWDGPGLTASAAAADGQHRRAVGVIQNVGTDGKALYQTFDGQPVTATDVLVRTTLYGDTNLDGVVDAGDYTRIDAGFIGHTSGWANGDFNYDGVVDGLDYTLMDNAFNTQPAMRATAVAETAAVPEPGNMAILVGTVSLGRRRRSKPRTVPPSRL